MRRGQHLEVVRDLLKDGPLPEAEVVTRLGQTIPAPYALRRWQTRTWRARNSRVSLHYAASEITPEDEKQAIRSARRQLAQDILRRHRASGHLERMVQTNGRVYLELVPA